MKKFQQINLFIFLNGLLIFDFLPIHPNKIFAKDVDLSALVPGLGTTLKYFVKRGGKIFLEAANPAYEPIELNLDEVVFQGKLLAVWRRI